MAKYKQIIREKPIDRKNKGYYQILEKTMISKTTIYRLFNKNGVYINSSYAEFNI